ncbi:unnamed protein product, partial [Discosporangium mesarthrocarpum]
SWDAADVLGPAMLRVPWTEEGETVGEGGQGEDRGDGLPSRTAAAAAAAVLRLIVCESTYVMHGIRKEQADREHKLAEELKRVRQLQGMMSTKVFLRREEHLAIAKSIWTRLESTETTLGTTTMPMIAPLQSAVSGSQGGEWRLSTRGTAEEGDPLAGRVTKASMLPSSEDLDSIIGEG